MRSKGKSGLLNQPTRVLSELQLRGKRDDLFTVLRSCCHWFDFMKDGLRNLLRKAGVEAYRYSVHTSTGAQLNRLLEHCNIDLVLDVGANGGHYANELRAHGYAGRIVSFEPQASAHARLATAASGNPGWTVASRMALGDMEGEITIHVAGNSLSSSILDMLPEHEHAAPGSAYVGSETVALGRLDNVAAEYLEDARRVLLKIDTQGYEDRVLAGAQGMLSRVVAIQTELSLVPLYAGQPLFDEMREKIKTMGFVLFAIFPGYVHERTGQTLQIDGFFVRREMATRNS
jgi:FkbM family methyltransferase